MWLFIMGAMYLGMFVIGADQPARQIIKQTTHAAGTNVVFSVGKDTFAFDGLTPAEYDSIFHQPADSIKAKFICPDCGEAGCIYEAIDDCCEGDTDTDITRAIYQVCKERNITDSTAIAWLLGDYYQ